MGLQLASSFTVVSFISVEQRGNTTSSILVMGKSPWTHLKSPKQFHIFCTLLSKNKEEKEMCISYLFYTNTSNHHPPNLKKKNIPKIHQFPVVFKTTFPNSNSEKVNHNLVSVSEELRSHYELCRKRFIPRLRVLVYDAYFLVNKNSWTCTAYCRQRST